MKKLKCQLNSILCLKFTSLHIRQGKLCKFSVHINCNRLSEVCMDKSWNKVYKLLVNNDKHDLPYICPIYIALLFSKSNIADLSQSYSIKYYFASFIFVLNFNSGGLEVE